MIRINAIVLAAAIAGIAHLARPASIDHHHRRWPLASADQHGEQLPNLAYSSPYVGFPHLAIARPHVPDTVKASSQVAVKQAAPGGAFQHGVASGDPTSSAVVLWTKISPANASANNDIPIPVHVAISPDANFSEAAGTGTSNTSGAVDWTIKFDIGGLEADTVYYYQFFALDSESPIGMTRTLPAAGANVDSVKFAIVSCATYWHGYFHGYRAIAEQADVSYVIHLGDYIYEYKLEDYPPVGPRLPDRDLQPAATIITLADYRLRHAQYKTDLDLQEMHRLKPMIAVWDHEFADNAWWGGAPQHDPEKFGPWSNRREAAARAWWEYLPTRPVNATPAEGDAGLFRIYRAFEFGNLASLILLDTRMVGRDKQMSGRDKTRSLLGDAQRKWFFDELRSTRVKWKLIGNQVMFSPKPDSIAGFDVNLLSDDWNGYPMEQQQLLEHMDKNSIQDVILLTGDFHTSLISNVFYNKTRREPGVSSFVEFIGPSITSKTPTFDDEGLARVAEPVFHRFNPGLKSVNFVQHGFMVATVDARQAAVEYHYVEDIKRTDGGKSNLNSTWVVASGSQKITGGPVV
ncbi:PhoD-like phosphatase-domain-containing protein [Catenaria anguillulae PL171]|uniref:PhoD-like phosphatase-domain-containing protein n=1 Tax=Catenaria anguillulae PL171 TaxID=765915 RepID=A0A1Y2HNF4_9FUNG|nr:PhoD-like phosphatase-domain-containing protein [Catenaria anguillulae PL171]